VNSQSTPPVFARNIYVSEQIPLVNAEDSNYELFDINTNLAVVDWHSNIVWSVTGLNGMNPTNATTADPLLQSLLPVSPAFQANSPAPKLGISSLSLSQMGVWATATLLPPTDVHVGPDP
jgi:hypothetical protein